jgi:hypothetical protein
MVATLTDDWKRTIRSRVTLLELEGLESRANRPSAPPETMTYMVEKAAEASPGLRARALAKFDLFRSNLALVRGKIMELGGSPRDGRGSSLGDLPAGLRGGLWELEVQVVVNAAPSNGSRCSPGRPCRAMSVRSRNSLTG